MRLIKITFVIATLAIVALVAAGVIYVHNDENNAGIDFDKKEFLEKTNEAVEKAKRTGSEELDRMGDALREASDNLKQQAVERTAPDASAPASDGDRENTDSIK